MIAGKSRRLYLCWLAVAVLGVIFTTPAFAQEYPNDLVLPDPNMQEEPRLPGTVEGIGTYFEVTDSNHLNITFESTELVNLRLESVPEMVVMDINSTEVATSTQITLTGFEPSTTYYKYEDDYHNGIAFTTDDNGTYTFVQDLYQPHLVFIQTQPGTKFIPSDTSIGTWDPVDRIYTLTTDVYETIQIDEDNLTLDGAGHTVTGSGGDYGVYLRNRISVTIKNVNVHGFYYGIYLQNSNNNTLTNNTGSNIHHGIRLQSSNGNVLTANTTSTRDGGFILLNSIGNTLIGNTASDGEGGIFLGYSSNNNTLINNTASNNPGDTSGIALLYSSGNTLIGNTTNSNQNDGIELSSSSGNTLIGNTTNSNQNDGIELSSSSNNTLIRNTASNNWDGISLSYSNDNILTANTTSNSFDFGIDLYSSSNNILVGNNVSLAEGGMFIAFSHNNTLIDNIASNNPGDVGGIELARSNYNTLTGNICNSNQYAGISLDYSTGNILTGNTASSNGSGIHLGSSSYNTLTGNHVSNNGFGIYLRRLLHGNSSKNNEIYNNNFIDNVTQTYTWLSDDNVFNLDKPIGGNYWSDWTSPDDDGDGFVDYPYVFTGGQDNLPWVRPFVTLVEIDIKPGSYPNAINLGSYGLVPVAILSSEEFDATTVDPNTVELAGAVVEVRGKSNKFMAHEEDVNGDGLIDLLLQVANQNLDPDSFQDGYAVLTGETYDGVSIEGEDEITIVPSEP